MTIKTFYIQSLEHIDEVAKAFTDFLQSVEQRKIISFVGKMGVGKTTFIKAICKVWGVQDNVCSPTFAIVNQYASKVYGDVYHFDFYRLTNIYQALDIGVEEYFSSGNYCLVEWAENIREFMPEDTLEVTIKELDDNTRLLTVNI